MGWINKIHAVSSNGADMASRVSLIAQNFTFVVVLMAFHASKAVLIAAFTLCVILPLPASASRKKLRQSLTMIAAKMLIAAIIAISLA